MVDWLPNKIEIENSLLWEKQILLEIMLHYIPGCSALRVYELLIFKLCIGKLR